jgi:hypothetical protein
VSSLVDFSTVSAAFLFQVVTACTTTCSGLARAMYARDDCCLIFDGRRNDEWGTSYLPDLSREELFWHHGINLFPLREHCDRIYISCSAFVVPVLDTTLSSFRYSTFVYSHGTSSYVSSMFVFRGPGPPYLYIHGGDGRLKMGTRNRQMKVSSTQFQLGNMSFNGFVLQLYSHDSNEPNQLDQTSTPCPGMSQCAATFDHRVKIADFCLQTYARVP